MLVASLAYPLLSVSAQSTTPVAVTPVTAPGSIDDLNNQIQQNKQKIEELQQQSSEYQAKIDAATAQARDIEGQIAIIDDQIAQTNIDIQTKQEEISTLELEMASLQQSIDEKTSTINNQKTHLADAIRQLDKDSRTSTLALVLMHGSLADFYSLAQANASVSQQLQDSISQLQGLRIELQSKQDQLAQSRDEIQQDKAQLEVQKQATTDQLALKDNLLASTKKSADQFSELMTESLRAEQQANASITALQAQLQAKIAGGEIDQPEFSPTGFMWPVTSRKVTAYFHDPEYPYRRLIGEHSGLDVGTPQGTPVRAASSGYVSVVHDQGYITNNAGQKIASALNYVAICHDDNCNLSSRYLHLSAVYVHVGQVVTQGTVIGLSGGLPGTAGAGGFTTGAHLHFEVRVNGLPDDPLKYLP